MTSPQDRDFEILPAVQHDLATLNDRVRRNPRDKVARNVLQVALNVLVELRDGHPGGAGTKPLECLPSYPDLSDCHTTYISGDPHANATHRVVWRDVPPESPGGRGRREVIAVGERQNGRVYQIAGQRLGRPVGFTLAELSALREPVADRARAPRRSHDVPEPAADAPEPQFE
ncbi:hypothetical protein [Amycolatopsis sp. CA-230715]|uniref:hypothetical protein n=1 Tax=Amycolatopsis sp. CA-230715 TaxID=2745196 RepID=UPI001C025D55|nr:hypothetical protein [Amycolatopsis sp. CA-230715]QWF85675.1 hypothetical protein HUW46_09130 [Amycolatopsis sp. CA-230715]